MTKKELKNQINEIDERLDRIADFYHNQQKMINKIHSRIDKQTNRINELFKIHEENCDIQSKNSDLHNERWEMLKEYLGIKEEEYAKLELKYTGGLIDIWADSITTPVKKTKLVKVNKLKK